MHRNRVTGHTATHKNRHAVLAPDSTALGSQVGYIQFDLVIFLSCTQITVLPAAALGGLCLCINQFIYFAGELGNALLPPHQSK